MNIKAFYFSFLSQNLLTSSNSYTEFDIKRFIVLNVVFIFKKTLLAIILMNNITRFAHATKKNDVLL